MSGFTCLLIMKRHILIFSYVLRIICDRVTNTNVLSIKENISMTHVQIHFPSLTRMCVCFFFACVVLYSVLRRTLLPFTVNLFIWKSTGNNFISYFRVFMYFKRGINTVVYSATRHWYFLHWIFRSVLWTSPLFRLVWFLRRGLHGLIRYPPATSQTALKLALSTYKIE
jgi:hypothetical protein